MLTITCAFDALRELTVSDSGSTLDLRNVYEGKSDATELVLTRQSAYQLGAALVAWAGHGAKPLVKGSL